uniref:Uncharacterized protein n=2 Tax=environmental samples TaxID=48479 RepID=C7FPK6_9BACT|nr:hypothetical protein [uncultured bacterium HF186_25m_18N5]ACU26509.1 hypothetical protein [uncultured bacterium HF186_25m_27D22]
MSARDLSGPALQAAEELLRGGQALTIKTRGGLEDAAGLVTLARRHPGRVKVDIAFFSVDPDQVQAWERGAASVESRVALARELQSAGAEVVATLGPLIPMVNDSERALSALGRTLRQAGLLVWSPSWVRYSPGLANQIRREVSRSKAKMLQGWFHMGATSGTPELPERVRQTILGRLHEVADRHGAHLVVCACTSRLGRGQCLDGPKQVSRRAQLELFG